MTPVTAKPLWALLSREASAFPVLERDIETDVAVIGGGIAGLSAALHLVERGVSVTVLEVGSIGNGASGRNNGQVIPTLTRHDPAALIKLWGEVRGEAFLRMLEGSADLLFGLVDRHGIDCDAVRKGWLQPAHSPRRAALAQRRAEQWAQRGAPARAVGKAEMAERLGCDAYEGGWLHEGGGHINPLAYTQGLARAAKQAGAAVHSGSAVTCLAREPDGWALTTSYGRVRARNVIVATAAYTDRLWPELADSIVPVLSYQVATEPLGAEADGILPGNEACSDTRMDLRYFRKDREGRLVSGAALALQAFAAPRISKLVRDRLAQSFPRLHDVRIQHVWGGRIAMTPERLPRLHRGPDGLIAWIGCNGRGLALATAMGAELAKAATGEPDEALAMRPQAIQPLPFAKLVARTARLALPYFRYRDGREIG